LVIELRRFQESTKIYWWI